MSSTFCFDTHTHMQTRVNFTGNYCGIYQQQNLISIKIYNVFWRVFEVTAQVGPTTLPSATDAAVSLNLSNSCCSSLKRNYFIIILIYKWHSNVAKKAKKFVRKRADLQLWQWRHRKSKRRANFADLSEKGVFECVCVCECEYLQMCVGVSPSLSFFKVPAMFS